jgi:hypothetical protein
MSDIQQQQTGGALAPREEDGGEVGGLVTSAMPLALRIWFDEKLFLKCQRIALAMSRAVGVTPKHLLGQVESCFAVVNRSLVWNLDPFAVAAATYQTPGGRIGYEGKLCHAALEQTKAFAGPINYEMFGTVVIEFPDKRRKEFRTYRTDDIDQALDQSPDGGQGKIVHEYDWSAVRGKFEIAQSKNPGKDGEAKYYAKRLWQQKDAKGLGVRISALVRGEVERRSLDFLLEQAFPLNSTLWATDPETQIKYTGIRRFSSVSVSGIFMGVPFDHETDDEEVASMRDVSPPLAERESELGAGRPSRPKPSDFKPPVQDAQPPAGDTIDQTGNPSDPEPDEEEQPEDEAEQRDPAKFNVTNLSNEIEQRDVNAPTFIMAVFNKMKECARLRDLEAVEEVNRQEIARLPEGPRAALIDDYHAQHAALARAEEAAKAQPAKSGPRKSSSDNDLLNR